MTARPNRNVATLTKGGGERIAAEYDPDSKRLGLSPSISITLDALCGDTPGAAALSAREWINHKFTHAAIDDIGPGQRARICAALSRERLTQDQADSLGGGYGAYVGRTWPKVLEALNNYPAAFQLEEALAEYVRAVGNMLADAPDSAKVSSVIDILPTWARPLVRRILDSIRTLARGLRKTEPVTREQLGQFARDVIAGRQTEFDNAPTAEQASPDRQPRNAIARGSIPEKTGRIPGRQRAGTKGFGSGERPLSEIGQLKAGNKPYQKIKISAEERARRRAAIWPVVNSLEVTATPTPLYGNNQVVNKDGLLELTPGVVTVRYKFAEADGLHPPWGRALDDTYLTEYGPTPAFPKAPPSAPR